VVSRGTPVLLASGPSTRYKVAMETVPPPPPEPKKKGLHPVAWVGIGCGGLLVVAVLAGSLLVGMCKRKVEHFKQELASNPHKAAAEMIVRLNPDLETVADDETAGEMTIRVKSSGEEVTVSYADLAEGRFTIKDGKGTVTSIGTADESQIPSWVPRYPNIARQASVFHQDRPDGSQGVWVFTTDDTPEQVGTFFDTEISWSNGGSSSTTTIGEIQRMDRTFSGGGREITLSASSQGSGNPTQVSLSYEESKP
jgi:hypothetical protein